METLFYCQRFLKFYLFIYVVLYRVSLLAYVAAQRTIKDTRLLKLDNNFYSTRGYECKKHFLFRPLGHKIRYAIYIYIFKCEYIFLFYFFNRAFNFKFNGLKKSSYIFLYHFDTNLVSLQGHYILTPLHKSYNQSSNYCHTRQPMKKERDENFNH